MALVLMSILIAFSVRLGDPSAPPPPQEVEITPVMKAFLSWLETPSWLSGGHKARWEHRQASASFLYNMDALVRSRVVLQLNLLPAPPSSSLGWAKAVAIQSTSDQVPRILRKPLEAKVITPRCENVKIVPNFVCPQNIFQLCFNSIAKFQGAGNLLLGKAILM